MNIPADIYSPSLNTVSSQNNYTSKLVLKELLFPVRMFGKRIRLKTLFSISLAIKISIVEVTQDFIYKINL